MPWSAKAGELLDQQYKPLAAASRMGLGEAVSALQTASARGVAVSDLLERFRVRATMADAYATALSHYDAPLASFEDLRLAPFHLLATQTAAHTDKTHTWHMETLADLCAGQDELLTPTPHRMVDLHDEASCADAVAWWEQLTAAGGEGMVVKPHDFIARNGKPFAAAGREMSRPENICASSTARSTAPRRISHACVHAAWRRSARWRCKSSRWAWKAYSVSWTASRCAPCMNAPSPCWRWSPRR